ncbi:MAG: peptide ABC transporter ATP-binding protein [Candidatus Tectimicrobiota bacterium]|nr:MAG: peptide ABC transporter ATP-binding protein [Candidatus Tectomicrobia bacterium]
MSSAPPVLEVRDLCLRFHTDQGTVEALDGVNLRVLPGEILGLVGESGCGKTATARAILGVVPAPPGEITGGRILFGGEDLLRLPERELARRIRGRAITLIPQDTLGALNPVFPLRTQLLDVLRWHPPEGDGGLWGLLRRYGRRWRRQALAQILALLRQVQLPDPEGALAKYPHEFSGGQRQRLLIAMALLPNPVLVIADEPTTALDVTIQAQILRLLRRLVKERGTSVLFITHDLGVVARLCDRVTVMYAGQEVETAPTAALFTRPAHPYTQQLLASLPDHRKEELEGIPGVVPSLIDPPRGCRFHTRCSQARPECALTRPPERLLAPGHTVRCHLY